MNALGLNFKMYIFRKFNLLESLPRVIFYNPLAHLIMNLSEASASTPPQPTWCERPLEERGGRLDMWVGG